MISFLFDINPQRILSQQLKVAAEKKIINMKNENFFSILAPMSTKTRQRMRMDALVKLLSHILIQHYSEDEQEKLCLMPCIHEAKK
jgi:hypothetical protein